MCQLIDTLDAAVVVGDIATAHNAVNDASVRLGSTNRFSTSIHSHIHQLNISLVRRGIHLFEREKEYARAIWLIDMVLSSSEQLPNILREELSLRKCLDLEHMKRPTKALETYEKTLAHMSHSMTSHRISFQRNILRLSKPPRRWKAPVFPISLLPPLSTMLLRARRDAQTRRWKRSDGFGKVRSVEHHVLESILEGLLYEQSPLQSQYRAARASTWVEGQSFNNKDLELGDKMKEREWKGGHTENAPIVMLFHLLTWDCLWCETETETRSESASLLSTSRSTSSHSDTPPNLLQGTLTVQQKRNVQLVANRFVNWSNNNPTCLDEITRRQLQHTMSVQGCFGMQHRGVSWNRFSFEDMENIACGLGGKCLSAILLCMSDDYRHWVGGIPDLMLWKIGGIQQQKETRLVEVKGPNDSLSDTQRAWIHLLRENEVDVMVIHVMEDNN